VTQTMPKLDEIRDMTDDLLVEAVREARREIFGLRFQHATGELENTARLRGSKRDLARALTVARQRGIDVERELARSE
jgi:large subunit ribosomal protein L29